MTIAQPPCTRPPQAQQKAAEAATREAASAQAVLARDVEIGALKGEVAALRAQVRPGVGRYVPIVLYS
jgi:hypothetical protein